MSSSTKRIQSFVQLLLVAAVLIVINLAASFLYWDIDLTEDKRFTLSDATYKTLDQATDVVSIEVYLEGEFPAAFKHLQNTVRELLDKFRSRNSLIEYRFVDPLADIEGSSPEDKEAQQKVLFDRFKKLGITPINLTTSSKGAREARLVFPAAVIRYGDQEKVVQLLQDMGGFNKDYSQMEVMNASINLLEYKFANTLQKMVRKYRNRIAILSGHGELQRPYTESLEKALFEYYDIARLNLDSSFRVDTMIDLLLILKPLRPFGEKHQFMIDQYLLNGGKVLWAVDMLNMEDDSLAMAGFYIPNERPLDIGSMLFNYGVRVNANMVLDWEASSIPLQVGTVDNKPQIELRKWFYHPRVYPYLNPIEAKEQGANTIQHPIVKNLDYVDTRYPSSLDTAKTKSYIKKMPLLRSSRYSKVQYPPTQVSFNIVDAGITQEAFTKGYQTVAMLLEGSFESYFRNRVSPEMRQSFAQAGWTILDVSKEPSKMIIIGDGDVARNEVYAQNGQVLPLGMNKYEGYQYGNRDFLMNCVEYLLDGTGVISARSKEIKLRPIDQQRAFDQETQWQVINLVLPLVILGIFGFGYTYIRRKRFGY